MSFFLGVLGLFYSIVLFVVASVAVVALADRIPGRGCFQPVDAAIGFVCLVLWPAFVGGLLWLVLAG